jgi:hypothetical protein
VDAEFAWQSGSGLFSIGFSPIERLEPILPDKRSMIDRFPFSMNVGGRANDFP